MKIEPEDRLDGLFGALSDRTRRSLLSQLAKGPATVGELARPFRVSLPAISKHLKVLEHAGLVRRRIDGRVHHCSLFAAPLEEAAEWLDHYQSFWQGTLEALAAHVTRRRIRRRPRRRRAR